MYKKYLLENKIIEKNKSLVKWFSSRYVFFFDDIFFVYSDYLYIKTFFRSRSIFFQRLTSKEMSVLFCTIYKSFISSNSFIVLCVSDLEFYRNFSFFRVLLDNNNMNFEFNKQFSVKLRESSFCLLKFVFLYYKSYIYTYEYIMRFIVFLKLEVSFDILFLKYYFNLFCFFFFNLFNIFFIFRLYVNYKSSS